jgi:hypothetical protein
MTDNLIDIKLWSNDLPSVGKWAAREKAVIVALNYLLLNIFREKVLGAKHRNLRECIGLVVPTSKHHSIKANLGVVLIS